MRPAAVAAPPSHAPPPVIFHRCLNSSSEGLLVPLPLVCLCCGVVERSAGATRRTSYPVRSKLPPKLTLSISSVLPSFIYSLVLVISLFPSFFLFPRYASVDSFITNGIGAGLVLLSDSCFTLHLHQTFVSPYPPRLASRRHGVQRGTDAGRIYGVRGPATIQPFLITSSIHSQEAQYGVDG